MRVEVRKTGDAPRIAVYRDDRVTLLPCAAGQKYSLPKEVVQFLVERELSIQDGFWGTIADEGKVSSPSVSAGRQRPHTATTAALPFKMNRIPVRDSEVIVGRFQHVLQNASAAYQNDIGIRQFIRDGWIGSDQVDRVWQTLLAAKQEWDAVPVEGSMCLDWHGMALRISSRRKYQ